MVEELNQLRNTIETINDEYVIPVKIGVLRKLIAIAEASGMLLDLDIPVVLTSPDARMPEYAHTDNGNSGADLFSAENVLISPGKKATIKTGVRMAIPYGLGGFVWDKSGVGAKNGQKRLGGVIDANYRGDVSVTLLNTTDEMYVINKGDKIAQIVFQPILIAKFRQVESLDDTERGEGAYGSTGR